MPNSIEITTNYSKAVEIAQKAVAMLEQKVYPFNQENLFPDAITPTEVKTGSPNHALYLFYAVALDSMRESKSVYSRARKLYEHMNFAGIPNLDESYIEYAIEKYFEKSTNGKTPIGEPVKTFVYNSTLLQQQYDNDPRNLKKETVEQTIRQITQFRRYEKQTAALLIKNMVKAGIWDFPIQELPIKIDRHVIRISLGTKVISANTDEIIFDRLVKPLSQLYRKVTMQENISPINLNDSFWAIGQYLCGKNSLSYCQINCSLNCRIRPKSDRQFTTLKVKKDAREQTPSLFK